MTRRFALLLLVFAAMASAASPPASETQKIEYLLAAIETLPSAQFLRNGTAYDAKTAAEHLRLKLQKAGSRVVTADDFIRICASTSSTSGEPYRIRFADGRTVTSEAYLRQRLAELPR